MLGFGYPEGSGLRKGRLTCLLQLEKACQDWAASPENSWAPSAVGVAAEPLEAPDFFGGYFWEMCSKMPPLHLSMPGLRNGPTAQFVGGQV